MRVPCQAQQSRRWQVNLLDAGPWSVQYYLWGPPWVSLGILINQGAPNPGSGINIGGLSLILFCDWCVDECVSVFTCGCVENVGHSALSLTTVFFSDRVSH